MEARESPGLFGSATRTGVVLCLALLKESTLSELARILGASVSTVKKAVDSLEQSGVISGRMVGRSRVVSFNPSLYGAEELRGLASKLALADSGLVTKLADLRRRPRRAGKGI